MKRLEHSELKRFCDYRTLGFESTASLSASKEIIGQGRAVSAFTFGLATRRKGYNIYVAGIAGSGKTTFAKHFAKLVAAKEAPSPDLAYVYNFKDPKIPKLISVSPGNASAFKEDLQEMLDILGLEIPKSFEEKNFEGQRNDIVKKYDKKRDEVFKAFAKKAKERDFEVRFTDKGMSFAPIIDGETVSMEDFEKLSQDEQDVITENSDIVQEDAQEIINQIRQFDNEARQQIEELEYKISLFSIGHQFSRLQEKYGDEADILAYLKALKEDVLENVSSFQEGDPEEDEMLMQLPPWASKKVKEDAMSRWQVNIVADNGSRSGAPVESGEFATYASIMGEVEYDSEFGNLTTDYMKIKGGLIHKANGGYLILQAKDVLSVPYLWDALKRTMKTKEIIIDNPKEHQMGVTVATVRPEAVAFDTKIIMIGSGYYYDIMRAHDEDFADLFKVMASFDYEMDYNDDNVGEICRFVKRFVQEQSTLEFSACAVAAVIEYSVRLAGSQRKLTSRFDRICETLTEAYIWAKQNDAEIVTAGYIKMAIDQREYRLGLYEEKMSEMIDNDVIMITTEGTRVGEINGLAAMDTGDTVFAKPTKITATTYVGKAGIVNIENEADMSGEIHDKGVQIVIGYLGQKYAQRFPLSLSCRVCFEQNYSGIDGDSASSTELYAIISSLSRLPINQGIAVSGSINQKGEIQAVGAITPKIEGFFDLCKKRGLTGEQGVIIPRQNITDLVLKDEVIQAVRDNTFHIFPISYIDEGIEILMGVPAGKIVEDDENPDENTVHGLVYARLKEFNERALDE